MNDAVAVKTLELWYLPKETTSQKYLSEPFGENLSVNIFGKN